jgi:hypothetical protein
LYGIDTRLCADFIPIRGPAAHPYRTDLHVSAVIIGKPPTNATMPGTSANPDNAASAVPPPLTTS